jgi:hypothetical protein
MSKQKKYIVKRSFITSAGLPNNSMNVIYANSNQEAVDKARHFYGDSVREVYRLVYNNLLNNGVRAEEMVR